MVRVMNETRVVFCEKTVRAGVAPCPASLQLPEAGTEQRQPRFADDRPGAAGWQLCVLGDSGRCVWGQRKTLPPFTLTPPASA